MQNFLKIALAGMVISGSSITQCMAFECRFYPFGKSGSEERKQADELLRVWNEMDQTLMCYGPDRFWNYYPSTDKTGMRLPWARRNKESGEVYEMNRGQVHETLAGDQERNLLVVHVTKNALGGTQEKIRSSTSDLLRFLTTLGFKRIIVFRDTELGRFVLSDSCY